MKNIISIIALTLCLSAQAQTTTCWFTNTSIAYGEWQWFFLDAATDPQGDLITIDPGVWSFTKSASWGSGSLVGDGGSPSVLVDWTADAGTFSWNGSELTYYVAVAPEPTAAAIFAMGFFGFLAFYVVGTGFRMFGRVADA